MPDFDCVYVSATWGIHDERWTQALRDLGHRPRIVVLGRDAEPGTLAEVVGALAGPGIPVLAGPLTTITRTLVEQLPKARIIGLSWGFDLHELLRAGDVHWLDRAHGLVIDSVATRDIAVSAGVDPAAIAFIPWGIDLGLFTPEGPTIERTAVGIDPEARLVLSLRAHEALYRVGDIIDGFAEVAAGEPDLLLVVGHSGTLTASLQARASALGIADRVRFIGTIEEAALAPWLRSAAVYVSASEVDGTSVTLLQAMACRTPVVVSDTPGNLGWVEDGVTGATFATGSVA
ncbi:MAG: glycosyltransferase, partial [Candidatus Nanopelagicales bacterium]|nr:glycosyltransferase [Candidatus Nanopelagicales bacterium]